MGACMTAGAVRGLISVPPKKAEEGKNDKDSAKDAAEAEKSPQEKLAEAVRDAKVSYGWLLRRCHSMPDRCTCRRCHAWPPSMHLSSQSLQRVLKWAAPLVIDPTIAAQPHQEVHVGIWHPADCCKD